MARVIEAEGLSKRFFLRHNRSGSLKERFLGVLHPSRREQVEEFWALRDVSLSVDSGEAIGIVGRNGSGKSTFLRLVAGIHRPTAGWLAVRRGSRIGTMIELGVGFHPELTGAENVFLSASVHGLTRSEIQSLYQSIVEYSGLAAFMDVALKNYSSGMTVRLAFAIAANLDPDMLLLDEVFAVGDEAFQQQCIRTMRQFRADGKTILFVSHSSTAVRSICDRVCLLDSGRLLYDGEVARGLEEYERVVSGRRTVGAPPSAKASGVPEGGWHRVVPGGCWAEGGDWAFELLRRQGLRPEDPVLDVGCGSLATGRRLLPFLEPGRYWGFDVNQALILAGVTMELPRIGVMSERGFYVSNHEFDLSAVTQNFRLAISEGFLSRLPLNRIARCIAAVVRRLAPDGRFFATWYDNPDPGRFDPIDRGGFVTYSDAEPYHYSFSVLAGICDAVGARAERLEIDGAGGPHPRGESAMVITCAR
jgi:ABC-type polysaccharide/polyol phosphate transport system ATPase subunit/SAM-dependent methyltransferase